MVHKLKRGEQRKKEMLDFAYKHLDGSNSDQQQKILVGEAARMQVNELNGLFLKYNALKSKISDPDDVDIEETTLTTDVKY